MERLSLTPAVAADTAGGAAGVTALEASVYSETPVSQADLEAAWAERILERDARVVRDRDRIVGYAVIMEMGEQQRAEACVHPDAHGRGVGTLLATWLEDEAVRRGAPTIHNSVLEAD